MTTTPQDSVDLFLAGFSCSQSVFTPLAVEMGMDRQIALKLAQSLSGGMFVGDACGALTGATLALGLKFGDDQPGKTPEKQALGNLVKQLHERFITAAGCADCATLIEGVADEDKKQHCTVFVQTAREIVDELLGG